VWIIKERLREDEEEAFQALKRLTTEELRIFLDGFRPSEQKSVGQTLSRRTRLFISSPNEANAVCRRTKSSH
jgi:hypothetical protein